MKVMSSRSGVLGWAGALAFLLAAPSGLASQEARSAGGLGSGGASVKVQEAGDQLVFFVPNASPEDLRTAEGRDGQVRVFRHQTGMICEAETGVGCEDVTEDWLGDPETACEGEAESRAESGTAEEEADACAAGAALSSERQVRNRRDGAVAFAVAIPATAFLWMPDGEPSTAVRSATEENQEEEEEEEEGENGDNGDNGTEWPSDTGQEPPMSEVPEPVSTTLVGLGLLGYAGNKLRRRLHDGEEGDELS